MPSMDFLKATERLLATREDPRVMYPGEFVSLIERHRHPRWPTIYIECNRWGRRAREGTEFGDHGTIIVANLVEQRPLFVIPCNEIPCFTLMTARWDERQFKWTEGKLCRGWRDALTLLVKKSYLRPSEEMTFLLGRDTRKLYPWNYGGEAR